MDNICDLCGGKAPCPCGENYNDYPEMCPRCKCCQMEWETCHDCGGEGGRGWEDLQFEDPLWYDEDSFEVCDTCDGKGGWNLCMGRCDENGKHKH